MDTQVEGDEKLSELLQRAGTALDRQGLLDLIKGVLAAPENANPDAWLSLVSSRLPKPLVCELRSLREDVSAGLGDGGLDGRRSRPDRLEALRTELNKRHLDGFVIPRSDEHQGEYVARRSERLAWLTGFTGSAGSAVVLIGRAAVFVDGRYTLQAAAEVESDLYDIEPVAETPPTDWIAAHLRKGQRLGYDPWLHTPTQIKRLSAACRKAGGELVAVEENLIDCIWEDQPSPPISPVIAHPKKLAGETSSAKRQKLAETLDKDGIDVQILSAPDSIAWLLNVRGADVPFTPFVLSFALLHRDGTVDWFLDLRKLPGALARHLGDQVRPHPLDALGPLLDALGPAKKKVRLDPASAPSWISARLEAAGLTPAHGADPCQLPKARKNAAEIEGMRAAHLRDAVAVTRFLHWLDKTVMERKITEVKAAETLKALRAEDETFRDLSFDTISGAGPNGAIVHYRVTPETNRQLKTGSLYLVDSGGQYVDGTTDITRTIAIGQPKKEMRVRFTLVLKGHIAIDRAVFPEGTTGSQLDAFARRPLWEAGLDYDHGTGHGVGSYLSVHEGPHRISKQPNTVKLVPGMVLSNEPGFYKTGAYGIRIENLVLVTEADPPKGAERKLLGFETLTLAPIDRALIVVDMLDDQELAWVNDYHQRVWRDLKPLVDKKTRGWLKHATRRLKR